MNGETMKKIVATIIGTLFAFGALAAEPAKTDAKPAPAAPAPAKAEPAKKEASKSSKKNTSKKSTTKKHAKATTSAPAAPAADAAKK